MKEQICLLTFSVIFVTAVVFAWLSISDAIKVRGARRAFSMLSAESRQQILRVIDEAARVNVACTIMVPSKSAGSTDIGQAASSRYGGHPYAEAGDHWPTGTETTDPATFLVQVQLDQPLPSPWPGRLLEVFYFANTEAFVRCYATPDVHRAIEPIGGQHPLEEWILQPVRIPGERVLTPLLAYDPYVLLKVVPELQTKPTDFTRQPIDFLSLILAPNQRFATSFELSDIVQIGGEPVWLFDDPGDQRCLECGRPMRFLFQFGDLNRTDILGDGGVCYVFGCDLHPDQPKAVVQLA